MLISAGITGLLAGLQQPVSLVATQHTAGDALHALAGCSRNPIQRQLVAIQVIAGDQQRHFPFRQVFNIHAGNSIVVEKLPANPVAQLVQIRTGQGAAEQQPHHPVTHNQLLHSRARGPRRQVIQSIQARADLLQYIASIMPFQHIQLNAA